MPDTHQITCAAEDCFAYSITGFYQPTDEPKRSLKHRRDLATDGWADIEGRDYCPDHVPQDPNTDRPA